MYIKDCFINDPVEVKKTVVDYIGSDGKRYRHIPESWSEVLPDGTEKPLRQEEYEMMNINLADFVGLY